MLVGNSDLRDGAGVGAHMQTAPCPGDARQCEAVWWVGTSTPPPPPRVGIPSDITRWALNKSRCQTVLAGGGGGGACIRNTR